MIKYPAYLTGFSSRADGSAGIRFATQELTGEDFAELKRHHSAFGWLLFSENANELEVPEENAEEEGISTSERLRRVLYVLWKQRGVKTDFELWRRQYMERLIDKIKEKLN